VVALALLSRKEGVSQRELGETLHLSAPRVSAILDSLEKNGRVERRADETDRRLARLFLTSEGRRCEKAQRDALGEYVNRTIGALSESDRRQLARLLDELANKTLAVLEEEPYTKGQTDGEVAK
jgi:DNA-binding MarR family transcriptional regulator